MIRKVRLYGYLREKFGPYFELDVSSAAEAVRAISIQVPGFRQMVEPGAFRVVCGPRTNSGLGLNEDTLSFNLPPGDLHIVPVVAGRGGRGASIGKIILGTVLMVASFAFGVPFLGSLGLTLALSGVASLLAPKKKKEKEKKSYMINGGANVSDQGVPVPLIYGKAMVSPITVSAGVTIADSNGLT